MSRLFKDVFQVLLRHTNKIKILNHPFYYIPSKRKLRNAYHMFKLEDIKLSIAVALLMAIHEVATWSNSLMTK